MNALAALLAQVFHVALMLVLVPIVEAALQWLEACLAGRRPGPSVTQPARDLVRLFRKQSVWPESGSVMSRAAPPASLAFTLTAACLVPSFTLGMAFAPLADLLTVAFLLVLARVAMVLAALDSGTALGALAGRQSVSLGTLAEPVLVLVVFVLAALAGTGNVDLIAAAQRDGTLSAGPASTLAAVALAAVAFGDLPDRVDGLDREFSGPGLALTRIGWTLRLLVWLNLLVVLFLPFGIAPADSGLAAWGIGLICWIAKLALLLVVCGSARAFVGRFGAPRRAALLAVALTLGLLAAVLALAGTAAA